MSWSSQLSFINTTLGFRAEMKMGFSVMKRQTPNTDFKISFYSDIIYTASLNGFLKKFIAQRCDTYFWRLNSKKCFMKIFALHQRPQKLYLLKEASKRKITSSLSSKGIHQQTKCHCLCCGAKYKQQQQKVVIFRKWTLCIERPKLAWKSQMIT